MTHETEGGLLRHGLGFWEVSSSPLGGAWVCGRIPCAHQTLREKNEVDTRTVSSQASPLGKSRGDTTKKG